MTRHNRGWLTSDWDSRDPKDDLHDIDTGKYLSTLSSLPGSLRQLMEDGNMNVDLAEVDGRYQVVKIVKKREPEFLQGKEQHFVLDRFGNRIPLTEEEFDDLLGIEHNPEDVFNCEDVDLSTLDSEQSAPMDVWDIVFDASSYLREARAAIRAVEEETRDVTVDEFEALQDEIYSADWFPYPGDKRVHGEFAKQLLTRIWDEDLSKRQLAALMGDREIDKRPALVKKMRGEAEKLPLGKQKATILLRAQKIMNCVFTDRRRRRYHPMPRVSDADRSKLWASWRQKEIEQHDKVELMPWQFKKAYKAKLDTMVLKEEISSEEASRLLTEKMAQHFGQKQKQKVNDVPLSLQGSLPEWLADAPPRETEEDNYEFVHFDWLTPDDADLIEEEDTDVY